MITLKNNFHNTEITLRINANDIIYIGNTTANKIKKTLCGIKDCQCGVIRENKSYLEKNYKLGFDPNNNQWVLY